jgi:hypothetical protein
MDIINLEKNITILKDFYKHFEIKSVEKLWSEKYEKLKEERPKDILEDINKIESN